MKPLRQPPSRLSRGSRSRVAACAAVLLTGSLAAAAPEPRHAFRQSDAVVVNLTQSDLNRVLEAIVRSNGGPRFEGTRKKVSRGVSDLHYVAELSTPRLTLGDDGLARLDVDIEEGGIRIGRLERRFIGRMARCEGAGAVVDPEHPVDIELGFRFRIEGGELRLVPERVSVSDPRESFRLVKPSRCENTLFPKWLVWWIGRPYLKRRLNGLDEVLLASASRGAASLNARGGLLRKRWEVGASDPAGPAASLDLRPEWLTTRGETLLVGLEASGSAAVTTRRPSLEWIDGLANRSFAAFSTSFLESLLGLRMSGRPGVARKLGGDFQRLLHSDSIYTLIPGLRDVDSRDDLRVGLVFGHAPSVELTELPARDENGDGEPNGERALIRVRLSGIELRLWDGAEDDATPVGVLRIDSAVIGVIPYLNRLGGLSFRPAENEWRVSSTGIRIDAALFAATLQEVVFGELFQTRYEPLWAEGIRVGDTAFVANRLRAVGDYLIVELGVRAGDGAGDGTSVLQANR
jgi:hypothetical protein